MSFKNQYNYWNRMQPQPDPNTPGTPGEPDEEEKEERAEVDTRMLYKRLEKYFFETRAIYLWGVVDDKSAKDVVTKLLLLEADAPGKEIKFFISSPGGSVTSGMVIYDTMKLIKSPVSTICMGLAASMGSILLSAGEKGKRFIYPHGEVMIHQPSLGGHIQGVSADMEIHAEQILRTKEMGARILADNTGQTIERIRKDFERDYWMDAEKSIEYGIVDKILDKMY
ncbi:ClpP family protease [Flavisolibacter ginsengisoli]|jgi:ATP-dependent Clp protease protease subunit|uniref:ATP-dependent Clp protease proteolytic subunit n=2 Tax=Flavisolibacter TaxID=398041 RepID=A0A1M4W3J1_9BACT|nr:ATP-dependent Clp protease proteolytic subunit [Flavisolibacter ginsengisoli]SHE75808.1 ATP-dependent Clp protease, protease subunit [Flavisolibacter ginsengisoli DSM 18119]